VHNCIQVDSRAIDVRERQVRLVENQRQIRARQDDRIDVLALEQQVYDLNYLDDQLVLGIKGTLSVVELKVLRQRLQAGQESKARRGELFKRLPVGYVLDAMGKVVFHPDQRVCGAIQLVFKKFRERWSVRQTFQWFRDHDVELPANPIQGTRLAWKIPTQSLIRYLLCNPFYSGAYVWGRRPVATVLAEGRLEKRQGATRRAEDCRVFIPGHHVGYIDWATYQENQKMIRRNSVNWQGDESMAAVRAGQGLLVGFCGVGIAVANCTYATGEAAAPMRGISAKEPMTMGASIASVLAVPQ